MKHAVAFAGHGQGIGTAVMQPGQPSSPWTCESTCEWGIGGHWLQCDTAIRFVDVPGAMRLRKYMGWDVETDRFVLITVSNMGGAMLGPMQWVGEDKLVTRVCTQPLGMPEAERSVTQFDEDQMSLALTFLVAEGMPSDGVHGKLHRVARSSHELVDARHVMKPVPAAMAKLARMSGAFDVQGAMTMAPATPAMKITGRDVARPGLRGARLLLLERGRVLLHRRDVVQHGRGRSHPVPIRRRGQVRSHPCRHDGQGADGQPHRRDRGRQGRDPEGRGPQLQRRLAAVRVLPRQLHPGAVERRCAKVRVAAGGRRDRPRQWRFGAALPWCRSRAQLASAPRPYARGTEAAVGWLRRGS